LSAATQVYYGDPQKRQAGILGMEPEKRIVDAEMFYPAALTSAMKIKPTGGRDT
jgi:hypothetical protein